MIDSLTDELPKLHRILNPRDLDNNGIAVSPKTDPEIIKNTPTVEKAISRINAKGAPGYDFVSIPHLKFNQRQMADLLTTMYNAWNHSNIIPNFLV